MLNLEKELLDKGFSKEVIDAIFNQLYLEDCDTDKIPEIDRKRIHDIVFLPKAWRLDDFIIGFHDLSKLMYFVGAENENELILKFGDLYIYQVEDEERFPIIENEGTVSC